MSDNWVFERSESRGGVASPGTYDLEMRSLARADVSVPEAEPPSYEECRREHERELDALAEEYEPYLRELAPEPTVERQSLGLSTFDFRMAEDGDALGFDRVLAGEGEWDRVELPDYRGPTGRWTGFYRTAFEHDGLADDDRAYLRFERVDYDCDVYLNGRRVGGHEGFFAPFECDVTDELRAGENVLLIEVRNDHTGNERGTDHAGEKLYAATGPGWNDPDGWRHCPPGAGIPGTVRLEERPPVHAADAFVRADPRTGDCVARVEVTNTEASQADVALDLSVHPRNFEGGAIDLGVHEVESAGPGRSDFDVEFSIDEPRVWSPEHPWLYVLRVGVRVDAGTENPRLVDEVDESFGVRSFEMDEDGDPAGEIYLNGDPVRLRGTNEMGHLTRAVMEDDDDQLTEDLFALKAANGNTLRTTQRPAHEAIYDRCDQLGILAQADLPLFGYLRRTQFAEAVRQSVEMERHVRGHPAVVLTTYVNEPFDTEANDVAHRYLTREEFEDFFEAATNAVHVENPDRVVKYAEGDHDPPTRRGIADFHTYTTWYPNHFVKVGDLHAGDLPPTHAGWITGCGEYGAEGLDGVEYMLDAYPEDWRPTGPDDADWHPWDAGLQTGTFHQYWYPAQETAAGWVEASQRHQARSVRWVTDALRRRTDRVVSSTVHLLIDAWPSGWGKTLVSCDRTPKRGYFALKDALEPLRVNLRTDRERWYAGDEASVEVWTLNDTPTERAGHELRVAVRDGDETVATFAEAVTVDPVSGTYVGSATFEVPQVDERTTLAVDAALVDGEGSVVDLERQELEAFPRPDHATATYLGDGIPDLFADAAVDLTPYEPGADFDSLLVESPDALAPHRDAVVDRVREGARVLLLRTGGGATWDLGSTTVETDTVEMVHESGLFVLFPDDDHPLTREFDPMDFAYCYSAVTDRVDFLADSFVDDGSLRPLVYTYDGAGDFEGTVEDAEWDRDLKDRVPVLGHREFGDGDVYVSELALEGRVATAPAVDHLLEAVIDSESGRR